jgi:hypothetical protein
VVAEVLAQTYSNVFLVITVLTTLGVLLAIVLYSGGFERADPNRLRWADRPRPVSPRVDSVRR